jgi:molecular chaperone GrpE
LGGHLVHDDDPPEGSGGPEEDPLEALIQPPISRPPVEGAAEAFQQRAQLAEDRLAEVLAAYRQLKTENEGFKERITRNLERRFDQRRERLLLNFIEILDNLDRALEATEQTYTGTPMIEGIILVRTQLLSVLQEEGLERIPVLGLPFDPAVAEAVETRPVAEAEHDHVVVKELLRGYRLNGRVARAARVAVGQYQAEGQPQAAAEDNGLLVGEAADEGPLVGEVAEGPLVEAEPVAGGAAADAALEDLLSDASEPPPPARPTPKPTPPAVKPAAKNTTDSIEIDLLKEVLEDE